MTVTALRVFGGLLAAAALVGFHHLQEMDHGTPDATQEVTAKPIAAPQPPAHYYAFDDGQGHYGYVVPVSDIDRAAGIGSKPYAMFSFWRMDNNGRVYVFGTSNLRGQVTYRCDLPCETVYAQSVTTASSEYLPVTPGTILWEVVQDVTTGQLKAANGSIY